MAVKRWVPFALSGNTVWLFSELFSVKIISRRFLHRGQPSAVTLGRKHRLAKRGKEEREQRRYFHSPYLNVP